MTHIKHPLPISKQKCAVIVSLPPRRKTMSLDNKEQWLNNNNKNNNEQEEKKEEAPLFLQLHQQGQQLDHSKHPSSTSTILLKRPPLNMESSTESCQQIPQTIYQIHNEKHQSDLSTSPTPNRTSILDNLYNDPAIVHVIEHAKATAVYNNNNNNNNNDNDSNMKANMMRNNTNNNNNNNNNNNSYKRGTASSSVHETHCPLQCGNRSPPKTCQDRIWQMISKKVDQQIDARIRSVFYPGYPDEQKLQELEIAAARLDRRILALEQQHQKQQQHPMVRSSTTTATPTTATATGGTALRRRQSMPPAANRSSSSSNHHQTQHFMMDNDDHNNNSQQAEAAKRLVALSSQTARLEAEKQMLQNTAENLKSVLQKQKQSSKQIQQECQGLYQKLAEEQKKSKQLEQQHVEFHKRQTADMIKMNQMQRRILQLEAELANTTTTTTTTTTDTKLPTPSASPPSSMTTTTQSSALTSSNSSMMTSSSEEVEEESVKEEDGYLVFNTNINGELIHCRVKIPSSAATSMRSSPIIRRHTDFPLALVSPPITRAGSPKLTLIPPLQQKKKGLNPNAPEWKNGL